LWTTTREKKKGRKLIRKEKKETLADVHNVDGKERGGSREVQKSRFLRGIIASGGSWKRKKGIRLPPINAGNHRTEQEVD